MPLLRYVSYAALFVVVGCHGEPPAAADSPEPAEPVEGEAVEAVSDLASSLAAFEAQIAVDPADAAMLARGIAEQNVLNAVQTERLAGQIAAAGIPVEALAVRAARAAQVDVHPDEQRYAMLLLEQEAGVLDTAYDLYVESWMGEEARTREGLAALLRVATDAPEQGRAQVAVRALGSAISTFRHDGYGDVLGKEIRRLTLPSTVGVRVNLDYRFLPPLLEALLDLEDLAGIQRVVTDASTGRGAEVVERYQMLVTTQGDAIGTLDTAAASCTVEVDGEVPAGTTIALLTGSHEVGCQGQAPEMIVIAPDEQISWTP